MQKLLGPILHCRLHYFLSFVIDVQFAFDVLFCHSPTRLKTLSTVQFKIKKMVLFVYVRFATNGSIMLVLLYRRKKQSNKFKNRTKIQGTRRTEHQTKPNKSLMCNIYACMRKKNPLKLVHLWKNPPYPFCWLRICTLLKNKYDHKKKNTTLSFGFISKIKIVRPKKKWNENRTLHTNRTRNCFDIRLSGWLSGKTTS